MAAPVVESVATGGTASASTTLTLNKPSGVVAGDLLVACLTTTGTVSAAPSGWTLSESRLDGASQNTAYAYYKVAGGSEPASYDWTFGANADAFGGISRVSGADGTTPINVDASSAPATSLTQTSPSVTTTVADCLIERWLAYRRTDVPPVTPPGSHTEQIDAVNSYDPGGGVSLATITQAAAGSTGTADFTISNAFRNCSLITLAIAPASSGQTVIVGLATETDTALAATARKTKAVGLASETDTPLACTARKTRTVGLAIESDEALPLVARKSKAVGLATETDTAFGVTVRKALTVGQAVETDQSLAVTASGGQVATPAFPGMITMRRLGGLVTIKRLGGMVTLKRRTQ